MEPLVRRVPLKPIYFLLRLIPETFDTKRKYRENCHLSGDDLTQTARAIDQNDHPNNFTFIKPRCLLSLSWPTPLILHIKRAPAILLDGLHRVYTMPSGLICRIPDFCRYEFGDFIHHGEFWLMLVQCLRFFAGSIFGRRILP